MKDNEPEDSEQMKQVSGLYVGTGLGTTAKLWTCWMYFTVKFVFSFFVIDEKKTTLMKNLSIYFGHHIFAFLDSFLKILNRYVLISISVILNK